MVRGGRFRLTHDTLKSGGHWAWEENPFVGTQPYQGLLVILVLFNSADLKNSNNTLYDLQSPKGGVARWFVVRDLGTSLGEIAGSIRTEQPDAVRAQAIHRRRAQRVRRLRLPRRALQPRPRTNHARRCAVGEWVAERPDGPAVARHLPHRRLRCR